MSAKECEWSQDYYGNYDTACGECFTFIEGGPEDNNARFCCYCGGRIVVKTYTEEEE